MTTEQRTPAPRGFINVLQAAIDAKGLSAREVCRQADISPAYLSRLLSGERGAPNDETIKRLEQILDMQPRGRLLLEAGRTDTASRKFLVREPAQLLMRTLAPLTDKELAQVQEVADRLARKHRDSQK